MPSLTPFLLWRRVSQISDPIGYGERADLDTQVMNEPVQSTSGTGDMVSNYCETTALTLRSASDES